ELPAAGWQHTTLPRFLPVAEMRPSSAWFRVQFAASGAGDEPWAVYLQRPYSNVVLYINGAKIGDGGPMTRPIPIHRGPLLVSFPAQLLRPGANLLELRSVHAYQGPRLGVAAVGPRSQLLPVFEFTRGFAVTAKQVSAIVLAVLATSFGALWWLRRRDTAYGWFALGLFAWAAHIQIMLVPRPPFENEILWQHLQGLAIGVFALTSALFVNRYTGLRQPRVERVVIGIWAAGAAVLIADPLWLGYRFPGFGRLVWIPMLTMISAYTVTTMLRSLMRGMTAEVAVLGTAGWLVLVVSVRDTLIEVDWLRGRLYLSYTVGFVLFAVAAVLLIRFAKAFHAAEHARDALDARVREKTAELERNLARVKDLERERALNAERERILQDMHDGLGGHLVQALAIATSHDTLKPVEEPLRACLDELRLMVDSLEPVNGDLASVLGSLRPRISRRLAHAGVDIHWQVDDLPPIPDLGPRQVLDVARVVQEAITNALKHSGCRGITVRAGLTRQPDGIEVVVEDNGRGLAESAGKGHGVASMRRRAAALGGSLEVGAAAPGTRVTLRLPVSGAANRSSATEQSPDQVHRQPLASEQS
ncbi:MAG TPA: ATP-binding protein, partial [Steroidobacteraceae bacterium]|nr:ATP-binding protein [Steroidobacteraceae bacterium]